MDNRCSLIILGLAAVSASAQTMERRADITGGGDRDRGRCTLEIVVDGAAEVDIRGDRAVVRNLDGQPPQLRRFVCNLPMPPNPAGFRFAGIDGRGRQTLVRPPEAGGPAVIRIEDPQGGADRYTFDIFWQLGGPQFAPPPPPPVSRDYDRGRPDDRDADRFYRDRDDFYRGRDWRGQLFARTRQDLDYVSRYSFRGDDRYRLDRVYRELDDLQRDYASGRWDRRALRDVVESLDRVVDDNRLAPRDRELLRDDQRRLRDLDRR